jgi:hypothetical protein
LFAGFFNASLKNGKDYLAAASIISYKSTQQKSPNWVGAFVYK